MLSPRIPSRGKCFFNPSGDVTLSPREVLLLAIMCGFAAFNLQSAHSKSFFNAVTVVPAVLFTLRILVTNNDNSPTSVGTVAMFWMYYGMGIICDTIFGAEESYLAVQLVFVGALGVIAYRGSGRESENDELCTLLTGSYSVMQHTLPPRNKTNFEYSNRLETATLHRTQSSCDLTSSTAYEYGPEEFQNSIYTGIASNTETAMEMYPSDLDTAISRSTAATSIWNECEIEAKISSPIDSGGLIATPGTIHFAHPKDTQTIKIKNISGHILKWRTNTVYKISAYPAQGVLRRGAMSEIKLVLNGTDIVRMDAQQLHDKLAIDYDPSYRGPLARFKHHRSCSTNKKQYLFDIFYHF